MVAEVGVHERINFFGPSYELTTYRFGPRFTRRSGKRLMMFAEALAGGARTSAKQTLFFVAPSTTTTTTTTSNGFAFGTGGGLDIGIRNWIAFRAVQAEYSFVHVNGGSDNGLRVGIGFTFRLANECHTSRKLSRVTHNLNWCLEMEPAIWNLIRSIPD
jgi:hypothetical protein